MDAVETWPAGDVLSAFYGISGQTIPLDSEWGGTFHVIGEEEYLLKVAPAYVSRDRLGLEIDTLRKLATLECRSLLSELIPQRSDAPTEIDGVSVRLYKWMPGRPLRQHSPHTGGLMHQIGAGLGQIKSCLENVQDDRARFRFAWAPHEWPWIKEHLGLFDGAESEVVTFWISFMQQNLPDLSQAEIPWGINYGDANDDNILVLEDGSGVALSGFIDYGDLHFGPRINDLAICLAYIMMEKDDPVSSACQVIRGYTDAFTLTEQEVNCLLPLSIARLLISVTKARQRASKAPDNDYWQISADSAWDLLRQLRQLPPHLVHCHFREAAGMEPAPGADAVRSWLRQHRSEIHPILGFDLAKEQVSVFDWSVASRTLGDFEEMADVPATSRAVFKRMTEEGTRVGIGRYDEPRPVYTTQEYALPGNDGYHMRTVHIGMDLFMPAGTPLYAPLDGRVHCITNNAGDKEYGPLLILEHAVTPNVTFYTLYGHNSLSTLEMWQTGDQVTRGQHIAAIGEYPENGNWVPHVHFQIIVDMLGYADDFHGVVVPEHRPVWKSLCPDPNVMLGIDHPDLEYQRASPAELLGSRRQVLGPNLSVSYHTPLHIVRGWQAYLFDEEGRGYLDTRNNIAHVGHEHPRLSRVARQQMALLNTNTRYLHHTRVALAERILSLLPDHLKYVYFVNSGSEANDLALRMARHYTGQQKVAVLDNAYHGHTQAVLNVSPYKFNGPGGAGCPQDTVVLPAPDTFRSRVDHADASERLVNDAMAVLNAEETPLVFLHESLPSCAGQLVPPGGYFDALYTQVHARGGATVADEIQTGLGRVGTRVWAFELFGLIPDIVTIGKPLGNGHPVAAVAVSADIAHAFDNGMEYFNSFGGNPVSCVVANEVLQIIEDEQLQQHAHSLGRYWLDHLRKLQKDFPVIGDVRGQGLFIGVEFSKPGSAMPAPGKAAYVVHRMLDHRILTSVDGPDENVIKIKPPLCFSQDQVDYFMEVLLRIMGEHFMQLDVSGESFP